MASGASPQVGGSRHPNPRKIGSGIWGFAPGRGLPPPEPPENCRWVGLLWSTWLSQPNTPYSPSPTSGPVSEIPRTGGRFEVVSDYQPAGDQPAAIDELERRVKAGEKDVVLLGATGTGKSATTAWLIERVQRPTLVMAPNKTLAAQLANELRELFPNNAVEYFVSYYDYYQPEAYIPQTDTYIEKDSSINDDVERLRHSATMNLLSRRDVIVVATRVLHLRPGHAAVLPRPVVEADGRHAARPGRLPARAGGRAVHAQRHRVRARHVPGARATRWRSSRPTRSWRSASSSSATRSRSCTTCTR